MSSILPTAAELLGLVLQTLLYGVYLIVYIVSLYFLYGGSPSFMRRGRRSPNKMIPLGGLVLFLTITPQWIIQLIRVWQAFIQDSEQPNGPLLYLSDIQAPLSIARLSLYVVEVFVSDFIFISRLWVVWARDWRITVAPILTWMGLVVCGSMYTYEISQSSPGADPFQSSSANWVAAGLALTLLTNIYCTGLLAWKIWFSQHTYRLARKHHIPSTAGRILGTLIESATLYTISSLIIVVAYFGRSFASFTCISLMAPLVGIAYCLVIVRFGLDGAFEDTMPVSSVQFSPPTDGSACTSDDNSALQIFPNSAASQMHRRAESSPVGKLGDGRITV